MAIDRVIGVMEPTAIKSRVHAAVMMMIIVMSHLVMGPMVAAGGMIHTP